MRTAGTVAPGTIKPTRFNGSVAFTTTRSPDRGAFRTRVAAYATGYYRLTGQGEAARLRHFGFDEGVAVETLHLGPFGRDPIAIRVGRMTVAIRRRHAGAVRVVPVRK